MTQVDEAVAKAMSYGGATEAVVGIWSEEGDYVSGFISGSDREFDANALFYGAQTLQPVLCAAVLQLVEDGELTLDREVSRDIPRQTGIGDVTYRELCDGTSGLRDFKKKFNKEYLNNPTRDWPEGQLVAEALIQKELPWPGLNVYRSDSAAVLLGSALAVRTNGDLNELLNELVFTPASMPDTFVASSNEQILEADNTLSGIGYLPGPNCEAGIVDFSKVSPTQLGSAGNYVTSVTDIKNFYEHLFDGTFGGEAGLATLTETKSTKNPKRNAEGEVETEAEPTSTERGFGVFKRGPLWGFDGSMPGSATTAWHNPETGFTVVVAINNSAGGSTFATKMSQEIAAIVGVQDLTWTAEQKANQIAKSAVCQEG